MEQKTRCMLYFAPPPLQAAGVCSDRRCREPPRGREENRVGPRREETQCGLYQMEAPGDAQLTDSSHYKRIVPLSHPATWTSSVLFDTSRPRFRNSKVG
ncbi:hypothetical protein NDU88_005608 [Pleurodeles waltl]|uniref:Uncharacterized protein n=1 Tax=Pleurodeles waltl TaxID=8319 RepID=A0AAV7LN92_PLEWA|nr:hypothetical protein NDU88_005608 [Pleurodeles waltl]